ncbi:MAG: GspE/PulE family protein, partial [bacterium]
NKEKKFLLSRHEYYDSKFMEKFKRKPDPAAFVLFMADDRDIDINEEFVLKLIARRAGCDFVYIDPLKIDASLVVNTISYTYGKNNTVLPMHEENGNIILAMGNPFRMDIIDQLSTTTKKKVIPVVASAEDIRKTVTDVFGFKKSMKAAAEDYAKDDLNNLEQLTKLKSAADLDDKHVVNAVDFMLRYAVDQNASDIHIEPKRNETKIRFRLDGILHTIYSFPRDVHLPFVSRIKMLARMDIAEKRRPQDGRLKIESDESREIDIRVSTIPVVHGEKVVLRLLIESQFLKNLPEIGFVEDQLERWSSATERGFGMLLVTGPTGSGKTTTLYSTLTAMASPDVNIVSVEDPIEIVIEEINQMGVNNRAGITFSSSLRHVLRQDPDIIMIGEIRDDETAENAVQAALTGHLVFSTLHTNDTASSVERIKDLGVEPFLIGAVLNGLLAQRLVRKVCPFCSYERKLTEDEKIALNLPAESEYDVKDAEGCVKCRYSGYSGRTAIMEFMPITEKTRSLISHNASTEELRDNALMDGMITLRESAIKKLADGITTFDEILKALHYY